MIAWNRVLRRDPQHAGRPAGDDPRDPQPGDPARRDLRRRRLDRADVGAVPGLDHVAASRRPDAAAAAAGYTVLVEPLPGPAGDARRAVRLVARAGAERVPQVRRRPHRRGGRRRAPRAPRRRRLRSAQPVFTPGTQPGDYQLTPPAFAQPAFTQWPSVRPFALRSASQFRPAPPPALTSKAYTAAFEEVQSLGAINSTTRPPTRPRSRSSGTRRSGSPGTTSPRRRRSPITTR